MKQKCSICGKPIDKQYTPDGVMFWEGGHNAEPINRGRCCSLCNETVVIPTRLKLIVERNRNE